VSNLRQRQDKKEPVLPIRDAHHLGRIGGWYGCQECGTVYTCARTHHEATLSHASHCNEIQKLRDDPQAESNLADEAGHAPTTYPRQGLR
jgi:hypothetical protein